MRTRTFIGLILLVIALMTVSTPALLTPASEGAEALLIKAGIPGFGQATATKAANPKSVEEAKPQGPVFILKGREATKENDLRDKFTTGERGANMSQRLAEGRSRTGLPGQLVDAEEPLEYEDAVLLDYDGCPVFRSGTDTVELWKDDELRALYEQKAAAADDPADCSKVMTARRKEAGAYTDASAVDTRDLSGAVRGGSSSLALASNMWAMWDEMFGDSAEWSKVAQTGRTTLNGS